MIQDDLELFVLHIYDTSYFLDKFSKDEGTVLY